LPPQAIRLSGRSIRIFVPLCAGGRSRSQFLPLGVNMHAAVRYSTLVLLCLMTALPHHQALTQQQEDEAVISHKIDIIKSNRSPPFVVIRSSQHYDRTVLGEFGIYNAQKTKNNWEWIRLGCLPREEIGPRLCAGLGGSVVREIASNKGGDCGISLYLVECDK
jgi:hypothetical protein